MNKLEGNERVGSHVLDSCEKRIWKVHVGMISFTKRYFESEDIVKLQNIPRNHQDLGDCSCWKVMWSWVDLFRTLGTDGHHLRRYMKSTLRTTLFAMALMMMMMMVMMMMMIMMMLMVNNMYTLTMSVICCWQLPMAAMLRQAAVNSSLEPTRDLKKLPPLWKSIRFRWTMIYTNMD